MTSLPLSLGPMTGAVVRQHAICVQEISSHGALFECGIQLPPGSVGLLQVCVEGLARIEVFRVSRTLTVAGSGAWRVGVEFLPIMPPGDRSLRATVAGFETAGRLLQPDGLKSGAPMTTDGAAAARDSGAGPLDVTFIPFPRDPALTHGDVITGNPVAHVEEQPLTLRRKAPIEEDR